MNPEPLAVPVRPFKVVHQTPQKVALYGVALIDRPVQLREVGPQVHDPVDILYPALCRKHIV